MNLEEIRIATAEVLETRRQEIQTEIQTADEARLDELNTELDAIEDRSRELALEERRRAMSAVAAGAGTVMTENPGGREERSLESVLRSAAYIEAFAQYIKDGDDQECRALLTDLVEGGSVPVPTYIEDRINTSWSRTNIIRRLRRVNIKGTAKFPFEYSATPAAIHTEGAAAPAEETLVIGNVTVNPQMLKKWITVSDEVMALKGQAFLDYVYDEVEHRILLLADAQAVAAIKAAPATASQTAAAVPVLAVKALDAFTIFHALALLSDEASNPVAIMNKQTYFNQFMSLTDTTERPIYNVVSENGRPTYYLNGIEVIFSDDLTAGSELIVGDLDGEILNLPDGAAVKFTTDPYSLAEKDLVKIVGRMYAGFGVVRSNFFVKVNVSA